MSEFIASMSGNTYRAALACRAMKGLRPALRGFHLDALAGNVVSTDGGIMYVNQVHVAPKFGRSVIIEGVAVPSATQGVCIYAVSDDEAEIVAIANTGSPLKRRCKIVKERFPDYQRIMEVWRSEATALVAFDPKYLAYLKIAFSTDALFEHNSNDRATRVTGQRGEGVFYLMPTKRYEVGR